MAFAFAAFGPLPSLPTVLTSTDGFTIVLLAGDLVLLGLAAYCTLVGLTVLDGDLARPWLWASAGILVYAMGDTVFPLLQGRDGTDFAGLLWCYGLALIGIGATVMLDVLRPPAAEEDAPEVPIEPTARTSEAADSEAESA